MKKLLFFLTIIILINFSAKAQLFCSYKKQVEYPKPSFYTLNYYPQIYNQLDYNKLNKIDKDFVKLEKKYLCYTKFYEKYAKYERLVKMGIKRYEKKMKRYNKKAQKYGNPFVNTILMDYLDMDSILSAKIIEISSKTKIHDSLKYISEGLKQDIQELTFKISDTKSNALSASGAKKTNYFIKAIKLNNEKIERKEEYIAFLLGNKETLSKLSERYQQLKQQFLEQEKEKQEQEQLKEKQKQEEQQKEKQEQEQYSQTTFYLFRIDQLSQKLNLSSQDKIWLSQYREAQNNIQLLEKSISQKPTKAKSELNKLTLEYWKAFESLYKIYNNHIKLDDTKKIQDFYNFSKKLYNQYIKTKDLNLLWQANHYLGVAVIKQENLLAKKFKFSDIYLTYDILPSSANTQKTKQHTVIKSETKQKQSINCIPSSIVYTYSINNSTPKILNEKGTYYRIYVGTTTKKVLPQEFREFQPITFIKVCRDPKYQQKKYYVGRYTNYTQAKNVANKLYKNYGIHAKVVKFINGKPAVNIYDTESSKITHSSEAIDIKQTKGKIYVVRIGTYSVPKSSSELNFLNSLYYTQNPDGKYIYFDGPYHSLQAAQQALKKLRVMGYNDAYIQVFNNGKKISTYKTYHKQEPINTNNNIIFAIQVGAFSKPLSNSDINKLFSPLLSHYQIDMKKKGSLYVYYVSAGNEYKHAKFLKSKIRNLGYHDAFLIAIKNNKIIPISQVIR